VVPSKLLEMYNPYLYQW